MTLLIVAVGAPELQGSPESPASLLHPLKDMWPELFSFFLAFLLLGRYWMAHHAFFAVLRRVDRRFILLNLTYLAFVAFLPFPTEIVGSYRQESDQRDAIRDHLAAISGMETVLFPARSSIPVAPDDPCRRPRIRYGMVRSTTPVVLFLLSIPIAWFLNPTVAWLTWLLDDPDRHLGSNSDSEREPGSRATRQHRWPPTSEPQRMPMLDAHRLFDACGRRCGTVRGRPR